MSFDLNSILHQLGKDKGIDRTVLIEAVESAMLSAARKVFGHNLNLETRYDSELGHIEVLQFKTVVDHIEDDDTQISLDEARRDYDPDAMIGDELGKKLDTAKLGRIAAQTAKQVIMQKFRDAERDVIYTEFKDSKGDLINGIVQRYDKGNLVVNLGRTDAVLPKREQIAKERYRQGDRIRAMILDIDPSARGPQIILTRSHPDFLIKLFALEVPEISEGTITVKSAAREPGERAKIAVQSNDSNIDPIGACVGIKGSRVHAVVQELRGEKIDIVHWTSDEPSFVARALAPAEINRVLVDQENHSMEVIVPDDQLAFAIGRKGQNVKLASKLSGWKIDVRSVTIAEEEAKRARASIAAIPEIQFTHAEQLYQAGYRSAKEVADALADEVAEIDGISLESANEIIKNAKEHVETLGEAEKSDSSDFGSLAVSDDVKAKLTLAGYDRVQSIVAASDEDLAAIPGMTLEELEGIRRAVETLFERPSQR